MAFGNYDEVKCPKCRTMVSSTIWINKLHQSVCHSCQEEWQAANPTWRHDELKSRMDKAYELYLHEKAEYEKLIAEGK